ncbi:MAG TPA: hypothetical protein EYN96_01405 [Candidatus Hydrogenedentes bacterium]|nr:hypothetical protein [Candidatus Hydrogenedentota bacterium]
MTEELTKGLDDGSLPSFISFDDLWVTESEHLKILGFQRSITTSDEEHTHVENSLEIQALLFKIAMSLLSLPKLDTMKTTDGSHSHNLPLHARVFLARLEAGQFKDTEEVCATLRIDLNKKSEVERRSRLWRLCSSVVFPATAFIFFGFVSIGFARLAYTQYPEAHIAFAAISELSLLEYGADDPHRTGVNNEPVIKTVLKVLFSSGFYGSGANNEPVMKMALKVFLAGKHGPFLNEIVVNIIAEPSTVSGLVDRPPPTDEEVDMAEQIVNARFGDRRIGRELLYMAGTSFTRSLTYTILLLQLALTPILQFALRGGPTSAFFGIRLLNASGKRASRFRCGCRGAVSVLIIGETIALAWGLIYLICKFAFNYLDLVYAYEFSILNGLVPIAALILTFAVAFAQVFFFERSLSDRIVGIYPVRA